MKKEKYENQQTRVYKGIRENYDGVLTGRTTSFPAVSNQEVRKTGEKILKSEKNDIVIIDSCPLQYKI
ncbi:hypothetical protein ADN00_04360 [Ornatilinea apprima]|uniref:Uncharacterized protein n=1 Tax=Ornatilinea apprima TaxID=1134406 RepID=A0A0P6XQN4_9CHLR|nr:hypothetical protein [Ornatilinea apprima]KPL79101.1 hypothetical protein ADN00_04360 [Ornatilinea apprima]